MTIPNANRSSSDIASPAGEAAVVRCEPVIDDGPAPDVLLHVIMLGVSIAVIVAAFLLRVRGSEQVILPFFDAPLPGTCTYRELIGLPCPGCGLTRCFVSLAHGDFAAAWMFNPAGILFFSIVAAQIPFRLIQIFRIRRGQPELSMGRLEMVPLGILIVALFTQWLLRTMTG